MTSDRRLITHGQEIPSHSYADQPYVIKTDDGAWLCVMTTGKGREGATGQFVMTQRSADQGKTWIDETRLEPDGAPENSWGVLLKGPTGRIFCFYIFNVDNLRRIAADPGSPKYPDGFCTRVDSLGDYVFKYSDDHGKTWSDRRITIPVREFDIDRNNPTGGNVRYFWNVGKPFTDSGSAYIPLHKVGGLGAGFFTSSEGVLVESVDLCTEADPASATWATLPEGDVGIRASAGHGPVGEEHSFAVLSDGSFFTVFRTISGYPLCSYSRDKGKTWSNPERMQFSDGRPMQHPRAANFVWKCNNGKYLYWFHNQGGSYVHEMHRVDSSFPYDNRNPVWMCGGVEKDSAAGKEIVWSEPDVVIYDDDPLIRMSYPDLIEEGGKIFVTETQKEIARVHELDMNTVNGLWGQLSNTGISLPAPLFTISSTSNEDRLTFDPFTARDNMRKDYGTKDLRRGITLDITINIAENGVQGLVLDNRDKGGRGVALHFGDSGCAIFTMSDGQYSVAAPFYPSNMLEPGVFHLTILVDGGPKIISAVCNGKFVDNGEKKQFGWTRFSGYLQNINSTEPPRFGGSGFEIQHLSGYSHCLSVSQAIALQRK